MGRHFIIVDDKHKDDGYRREEMRQRMNGYRKTDDDYDEGYRTGYEHAWRDYEENMKRDSRGRYM